MPVQSNPDPVQISVKREFVPGLVVAWPVNSARSDLLCRGLAPMPGFGSCAQLRALTDPEQSLPNPTSCLIPCPARLYPIREPNYLFSGNLFITVEGFQYLWISSQHRI